MSTEIVSVEQELKNSYLSYAMSVILSRAIPDLYDGLIPVHRRILLTMCELGLTPNKPFVKAARVSGQVQGSYHPHGSCFGSMVTMASTWANNNPLINGQGNWGSPTDPAAHERYVECKLTEFSDQCLLQDLDIAPTKPNYDGSLQEVSKLSVRVPYALVNSHTGIGVGFASSIAPHNLKGILEATISLIKGEEIKPKHLLPDFPSGCDIVKDDNLVKYLETGNAPIRMRAKVKISEEGRGRYNLEFSSLPFGTNTEKILEQIKLKLEEEKLSGIADIRDETDRTGVRLIVITKAKVDLTSLVANLYRHTDLDSKFNTNNLLIKDNKPVLLTPLEVLKEWLSWRDQTLVNKFTLSRDLAEDRLHKLNGLLKVFSDLKLAVEVIFEAETHKEAKQNLIDLFDLTEIQVEYILETKLRGLNSIDKNQLCKEIDILNEDVLSSNKMINDKQTRDDYLIKELSNLVKRFGVSRLSSFITLEPATEKTEKKDLSTSSAKLFYINENIGLVANTAGRGYTALELNEGDHFVPINDKGMFCRLTAGHKGSLFSSPSKITHLFKRSDVSESDTLLILFSKDGVLREKVIKVADLFVASKKERSIVPDSAKLELITTGKVLVKRQRNTVLIDNNLDRVSGVYTNGRIITKLSTVKEIVTDA